MTSLSNDELRKLCDGATEGPWSVEAGGKRGAWIKGVNGEWSAMSCGDTDERADANAAFIAAARTELPRLLGEVERLTALLTMAAIYLDELGDNLSQNDVDMMLDPCRDPKEVAAALRSPTNAG